MKNLKRDSKQVFILDHKVWALRRHSYIEKLWLTIIKWRSHFVLGVAVLGVALVALSLLPVTERATPNGPRHRDSGLPGHQLQHHESLFGQSNTFRKNMGLPLGVEVATKSSRDDGSSSKHHLMKEIRWNISRSYLSSDATPAPLDLASFFSLSKRSSAHVCSARELEAE